MKLDMKIAELPGALGAPVCGAAAAALDLPVDLCLDSRKAGEGSVFLALKGERFDGHDFVRQVLARGAAMAIVDEKWVARQKGEIAAYVPVKNTAEALLSLASWYGKKFAARKIAITGSNGKTTTKEMVHAILSRRWKGIATEGNFNNQVGVPLTLFRLKHEHRYAVVEMGTNHPGEIASLTNAVLPDVALITMVGDSHLEFFGDRRGVFREKSSIAQGLRQGGWLVVNADDDMLCRLRSTTRHRLLTFGVNRGQVRPKNLTWDENACARFVIGRTEFRLSVPGVHSLYDALGAIAVGTVCKVPKGEMAAALRNFRGAEMRMQLREAGGVRVAADCYNANPTSMRAALQTVGRMRVSGNRVAVLGDMLELGSGAAEMHEEMGALVPANGFDRLVTVGKISKRLGEAAVEAGLDPAAWIHCADAEEAGGIVAGSACPGDLVLVKASHSMRLDRVVETLETREERR